MLHVSPEKVSAPGARELIAQANREWSDRFAGVVECVPLLDEAEFAKPGVVFLMAWFGGDPAGFGVLTPRASDGFEVRGLYVDPTVRGRGIGGELLRELEKRAALAGRTQLVAYAGDREPEAQTLLVHSGYACDPESPPHGRAAWLKTLSPAVRVA